MSWWVHVRAVRETDVLDRSPTYNLAPMFHAALDISLSDLDGERCTDCEPIFDDAVRRMQAEPAKYRSMEPSNGWGTYDDALQFMQDMLGACRAYPDGHVVVH